MEVNQDLLNNFKEVCAVDDDKARQYLVHCDGDLQAAVQLFFQTGGTLQNSHESMNNMDNEELELRRRNVPAATNRNGPEVPNVNGNRGVARGRAASGGWMDWIVAVVALPFRFTITTLWEIFNVFSHIFSTGIRPAVTDPRGDVERFLSDYRQHYTNGQQNTIEFFHGTYEEALRQAKSSLRLLLVYLHNPNHKDTVRFVSDVLHSAQMSELIRNNNLLVFGASISTPQGAAISSSIRPNGYPFIAMLSLRNNRMSVAIRLGGASDAESTCLNLQLAIDDSNAQLNVLRLQKVQREEDQRIRAEQEREYKESAAKDRARFQERKRLESEKADAEEAEKEVLRQAEQRKQEIASRRLELRASLGPEPAAGTDIVRVQVRFPSGARFDRRFQLEDNLEDLLRATLAHEKCPDFITLHTTYPRKQLHCDPEWYHQLRSIHLTSAGETATDFVPARSFREEGLEKSLVVMVHDCEA